MKAVSVIVPVHDSESYLRASLLSLQNQTMRDLQIILVENGSTDGSAALCDALASEDPRIIVLHLPVGDLSTARNTGILHAEGEYVGFMDSDDTIEPEMYEQMYALAKENNLDVVCCNLSKVYPNGGSVSRFSNNGSVKFYSASELTALFMMEKVAFSACTMLVRRKLYNNICYPEGKAFEDRFTLHLITSSCNRAAVINRRFYKYLQRDGSICHTPDYRKYRDACEAESGRLRFICESGMFADKDKAHIAKRPAGLLVRNLRHLIILSDSDSSAEVLKLADGLSYIPKGTFLSPRNCFIRKKISKWVNNHQLHI